METVHGILIVGIISIGVVIIKMAQVLIVKNARSTFKIFEGEANFSISFQIINYGYSNARIEVIAVLVGDNLKFFTIYEVKENGIFDPEIKAGTNNYPDKHLGKIGGCVLKTKHGIIFKAKFKIKQEIKDNSIKIILMIRRSSLPTFFACLLIPEKLHKFKIPIPFLNKKYIFPIPFLYKKKKIIAYSRN